VADSFQLIHFGHAEDVANAQVYRYNNENLSKGND